MSIANCLGKIKDYVKKSGLDKQVPNSRLEQFAKRLDTIGADSLSDAEFAKKAQDMIEGELTRDQLRDKAARAMALVAREKNTNSMEYNRALWSSDKKFGNPDKMGYEAARVLQGGGSPRPGMETRMSTAVTADGYYKKIMTNLEQSIKAEPGLEKAAQSGALDSDGVIELGSIDRGTQGMTTGNEQARQWAKVMKGFRDGIFQMRQAASPYVGEAQDFLWKQMHDRERIQAMGKPAWLKLIMDNAGQKSFPDAPNGMAKANIFSDIYDRITSGKWGSVFDDLGDGNGPNIARKMGESRKILFNDDTSFATYNKAAGPPTMYEGMLKIARQTSHDLAIMEKWGPSPDSSRDATMSRWGRSLSGPQADYFQMMRPTLDAEWRVIKGSQGAPAYTPMAKFVQGALTTQYLTKAMSSIFRSQQDMAMGAALVHTVDGSNLIGNQMEIAAKYASYLVNSTDRRAMLKNASMLPESVQRNLLGSLGSPESAPGTLSKAAQLGGTISFNIAHHEAISAAVADVLTKRLGDIAHLTHAQLPEAFQKGLLNYGITDHAWNVIRLGTEEINGTKRVTPDGVTALPDAAHENYLRNSNQFNGKNAPSRQLLDRSRNELSSKLGTAINENSSLASARPDTRQKDFMWGDTNINQGWGQLRRMFWEFKAASMVSADVGRRMYYNGTSMQNRFSGVAQYMIGGASAFIVGDVLKTLSQNKTPEDPRSLNYVGKVLAGSGLTGVYMDTLVDVMNEKSIPDKGFEFLKTAAGPAGGDAIKAALTGLQAASDYGKPSRHGAASSAASSAANLASSYIPNVFWAKAILDYTLADNLKQAANPRFKAEQARRLMMNGQTHLIGD